MVVLRYKADRIGLLIEKQEIKMMPKRLLTLLAFLLVAFAALPAALGTPVALAEGGGEDGHPIKVTFTKWVTNFPNMAGFVGGDVGAGTFAGEILSYVPGSVITKIEAMYHVNGGLHAFSAHVFVTENEVTRRAVINGVVTDGWLEGSQVHGHYNIISCSTSPSGVCFQGTLHIQEDSER